MNARAGGEAKVTCDGEDRVHQLICKADGTWSEAPRCQNGNITMLLLLLVIRGVANRAAIKSSHSRVKSSRNNTFQVMSLVKYLKFGKSIESSHFKVSDCETNIGLSRPS